MKWEDYYYKFYEWSESTQVHRISSLTDFTSSEEVAEIVMNFINEKAASRLVNKSISQGLVFSANEIYEMAEFVNPEALTNLLKTCKEEFTYRQLRDIEDLAILSDDEIEAALLNKSVADNKSAKTIKQDINKSDYTKTQEKQKSSFLKNTAALLLGWKIGDWISGDKED